MTGHSGVSKEIEPQNASCFFRLLARGSATYSVSSQMSPEAPLLQTDCPDLSLIARGKASQSFESAHAGLQVRDIYSLPDRDDALLFVATDRVSAFDVIMKNVSLIWSNEH